MDKGTGRFIIIDDDPISIMVTEIYIRKESERCEIKSFTLAPLALKYFEKEYGNRSEHGSTLLLLDLHMPVMDGFEFLECFEKLQMCKAKIKIVALSVAPDKWERQKVMQYSYVTEYLTKPLTRQVLKHLIIENGFSL
jgi:CheY-like chemotaxis protein